MNYVTLQTSGGPLGFLGHIHTDRPRPSILAVNGSFPSKDHLHDIGEAFPGANVLVVNLPGMLGVPWAHPTVDAMAQGLDEAIALLLPNSPILALGASTGNLVAFGLKSRAIKRRIAVEPFFQTGPLWPFVANGRGRLSRAAENAPVRTFLWNVFGIAPDRLENRDYRHLLAGITQPTDVVVGGLDLLPPRDLPQWPSFTSADDRAALAENPLVTLHVGPPETGHGYGSVGPSKQEVLRIAHLALRDLIPFCL